MRERYIDLLIALFIERHELIALNVFFISCGYHDIPSVVSRSHAHGLILKHFLFCFQFEYHLAVR